MNFKAVFNTLSIILKYMSFLFAAPCICAVILKEYNSIPSYLISAVLSFMLHRLLKSSEKNNGADSLSKSESLAAALFSWLIISFLSAVPYIFCGLHPVDALFEAVSGITAAGGTILTDFSLYPKTMFFWRSFSQWLGGMGILVLFTAVMPSFAAGRQIFYTETSGSSAGNKLTPRVRQTAAALWSVYAVLTLIEICLLSYAGMPFFDALCNSLSCLSGGGFSPQQDSIMHYASPKICWIMIIFMFLSGMNFALQYKVYIKHNLKALVKDDEFRLYLGLIIVFTVLTALTLHAHHIYDINEAFEKACFQVVSMLTTAGFASADYNEWNTRAKLLLFMLMFTGASAGSASGGLKLIRAVFIFKYIKRRISQIYHPSGVYPIKINKVIVPENTVREIAAFVIFYYAVFAVTAALMIYIEQDVLLGASSAAASLSNTGPAFGAAGPMGSFQGLHELSKLICIFNMLAGRLELLPFLALLHPDFWTIKRKRTPC